MSVSLMTVAGVLYQHVMVQLIFFPYHLMEVREMQINIHVYRNDVL